MKTNGKLLQRDFKRLIKAPAALIVVIVLIICPPSIPGLMLQVFGMFMNIRAICAYA